MEVDRAIRRGHNTVMATQENSMTEFTKIEAPTSPEPTGDEIAYPGDYIAINIHDHLGGSIWFEGTILKVTGNCRTAKTTMYWMITAEQEADPDHTPVYYKTLAHRTSAYRLTK